MRVFYCGAHQFLLPVTWVDVVIAGPTPIVYDFFLFFYSYFFTFLSSIIIYEIIKFFALENLEYYKIILDNITFINNNKNLILGTSVL